MIIDPYDVANLIKVKIEDMGGPPVEKQRLIYNAKIVEDNELLKTIGITEENASHNPFYMHLVNKPIRS